MPPAHRIALLCILGLSLAGCGRDEAAESDAPDREAPAELNAVVLEAALHASALLVEADGGRVWSVSMARTPAVRSPEGRPLPPRDLLPGLPVRIVGEATTRERFRADSVLVLERPPLVVVQPRDRTTQASALLRVEGHVERGRNAAYALRAGDEVVAEGVWRSETLGTRHYASFSGQIAVAALDLPEGYTPESPLTLAVWPEGTDGEPVERRLRFTADHAFSLYFPSTAADPNRRRCGTVYPVQVRLPLLTPPDRIVEMLVEGPPQSERRRGFFSALEPFGGVRSVCIEADSAVVDLPSPEGVALEDCDVEAALAQIKRTLGERFGVERVRVTLDGTTLRPRD